LSFEAHVLRRTSFGISPAALSEISSLGVTDYLQQQLDYLNIDDSTLEAEITSRFPLASAGPATLHPDYPGNIAAIAGDLIGATLFRAYFSPRQLYEVMAEFWSNHFNIHFFNGIIYVFKPYDDFAVIRPNALKTFRDLLFSSAKSPAMLYYLDNFLNFAGSAQENYARELLELHTLGVDGGFTENDIKEVARCFTGWTVDGETKNFIFDPEIHDTGQKTVLGNIIPAGGGIGDGETVLDILADHPSTAAFIAEKLCRRFVSDDPPSALVSQVAASFESSGGDISEILRTIFSSTDFQETRDTKLSRPTEFIGQLVRAFSGPEDFPSDDGQSIYGALDVLAQVPFNWFPPNGYPDVAEYWGSTSGFLNRWRISLTVFDPAQQGFVPLPTSVTSQQTIAAVVDTSTDALLFRSLLEDDRELIISWLETETGVTRDAQLDAETIAELAGFVLAILTSSAYFQLR